MQGQGAVIAKKAYDFSLPDQTGEMVTLSEYLLAGPVLLAFYPGDFTPVCTSQLCNYRDFFEAFQKFGLNVLGISSNSVGSHAEFATKYNFPFKLLSDPGKAVAKEYGATSFLMLGAISRAVYIVSQTGLVLYRYVEPTVLTRRKAEELVQIIGDLRANKLL